MSTEDPPQATPEDGGDTTSGESSGGIAAGVPGWLLRAGIGSWSLIGIALVVTGVVFATMKISMVFVAVFVALVLTGAILTEFSGMPQML